MDNYINECKESARREFEKAAGFKAKAMDYEQLLVNNPNNADFKELVEAFDDLWRFYLARAMSQFDDAVEYATEKSQA